MPPHRLSNFEIEKYYRNKLKLNGVCSRNHLPLIKDGAYVINLVESQSFGTHWIAVYVNCDNITLLIALELNIFWKKFKKLIVNNNITANIFGIKK